MKYVLLALFVVTSFSAAAQSHQGGIKAAALFGGLSGKAVQESEWRPGLSLGAAMVDRVGHIAFATEAVAAKTQARLTYRDVKRTVDAVNVQVAIGLQYLGRDAGGIAPYPTAGFYFGPTFYRAEHVGDIELPAELLAVHTSFDAGAYVGLGLLATTWSAELRFSQGFYNQADAKPTIFARSASLGVTRFF